MPSTQLARSRRKAQITRDHVRVPQRPCTPDKGAAIPARPADGGGDRGRYARAGDNPEGIRLRRIIVVLWRAGLRISEALSLNDTDLDPDRGSLLIRHGNGDKRREVGMNRWAWTHLNPWLELRAELPTGRLFCVLRGPTRGRPCTTAGIRAQLHHAAAAGIRRRLAPHQLRHAHAVEMSREGISLIVIQRQHADLAITSRYLRGIDNTEIIAAVHERPAPMIPADPRIGSRR